MTPEPTDPVQGENAPSPIVLPAPVSERRDGIFVMDSKKVAIFAAIFSVTCLAALAVVAAVDDAGALATIALALAVLTFSIQIIVFIAQAQESSAQAVRNEELNADTRAVLAEVRTTGVATQTMVGEQFQGLLRAFVDAVSTTSQDSGKVDPQQLERRLMESMRREFGAAAVAAPASRGIRPGTARSDRPEGVRTLLSFPDRQSGEPALRVLEELTPDQIARLLKLAEDEIQFSGSRTSYVGLHSDPADAQLADLGLVTQVRVRDASDGAIEIVTQLTDTGRQVARFLTALGEVPTWARGRLPQPEQPDDEIPF
jgi:hypothetical protein